MAPVFILLFTLTTTTVGAQPTESTVQKGATLSPQKNTSWLSNSGLYAFGFYQQPSGYYVGVFFAGIPQKIVVWTANRDKPSNSSNDTLQFTSDGRLILQSQQGPNIDVVIPLEPATSASMLDSGNFVLYNSGGKVIWQSFDYPTDTLLQGQQLQQEPKELICNASPTNPSTGIFRLRMVENGNLVQSPANTLETLYNIYWKSDTYTVGPNCTLKLDEDGHLYLLKGSTMYFNLTGPYSFKGRIYLMRIDSDGIFRLYSYTLDKNFTETILWSSTGNRCEPKGLCGLYGFCTLNDQKPVCECLPGFARVDEGNITSGCERNFTIESCKNNQGTTKYTMESVPNSIWEDDSYQKLSLSHKEDCEAACLDDCRCEAVLFIGQECSKQKLPLRFGIRQPSNTAMAMVKVGTSVNTPSSTTTQIDVKIKENKKEIRKVITIVSASFVGLLIILSGIFIATNFRYRTRAYKQISNNATIVGEILIPKLFKYVEVETMTNNFEEIIGKGACGTVFKGRTLDGEKVLAVKRLENISVEGEKEFQTEMTIIGQTYHRNLVRLLGYCNDGPKRLLVIEYMSNGSLAEMLQSPERRPCWEERIRIASDIARGLLYLHEECEAQIIHCDIKSQNVLMDGKGLAKISDFGLAKLLKADQSKTLTGIRGTKGYVAPEWHKKLPVTVKADVYSYGIVLLEIISCRRCIDWNLPEEEAILEEWVYKCFEARELDRLIGDEEVNKNQLERMVKVGLWCVQGDPLLRPSMKKVLLMLEGTVDIPEPPGPTSFFSVL